MPESVERLEIWQLGVEIVRKTYALSRQWPREELYGLTNQARRAAVSIPANLAEGTGRGTAREASRYAQIALGSTYELDTLVFLAMELGYSSPEQTQPFRDALTTLAKRIASFVRYQESRA